mmetsp:Transcript_27443/g.41554  ORF Transcript_27443/g.41554 Transcript_27443/m.41554 type:complete len:252 (-) Transcript_27443:3-758(-)
MLVPTLSQGDVFIDNTMNKKSNFHHNEGQKEDKSIQEAGINLEKLCRDIVKEYQKATLNHPKTWSKTHLKPHPRAWSKTQLKAKHKRDPVKSRIPHSAMWQHNFNKLLAFREDHKHCHVPVRYNPDPSLARWVKRQRYHHMLYESGKPSPIKPERIKMLENIGFTWNAQEALWQERLNDLKRFKRKHGHCAIPTIFPEDQTLATWVKFQRRQYKLYMKGDRTYMTADRIETLEQIGFQWKQRSYVDDFVLD